MKTARHAYVPKIIPLMAYIGLDDEERALEALKLAIEERSPWLSLANIDPRFDRVRTWMGPGNSREAAQRPRSTH